MLIEASSGESIYRAAQRAPRHCNMTGQEHELRHNGVKVRVYPYSHEYDIVEKWELKRKLGRYDDVE